MGKPGIMVYFEIRPCLELMTMKERGELLTAMLEYGETGEEPKLAGNLRVVWPLIRDKLDRDTKRYDNIVMRNRYASYAKTAANNSVGKLSYDQWKELKYPNRTQWET